MQDAGTGWESRGCTVQLLTQEVNEAYLNYRFGMQGKQLCSYVEIRGY